MGSGSSIAIGRHRLGRSQLRNLHFGRPRRLGLPCSLAHTSTDTRCGLRPTTGRFSLAARGCRVMAKKVGCFGKRKCLGHPLPCEAHHSNFGRQAHRLGLPVLVGGRITDTSGPSRFRSTHCCPKHCGASKIAREGGCHSTFRTNTSYAVIIT